MGKAIAWTKCLAAFVSIACGSSFAVQPTMAGPIKQSSDMASEPAGPPPRFVPWTGEFVPGSIYVVPANPAKGFHWQYVLAVPMGYRPGSPLYVEPNNDGKVGGSIATHQYWALLVAEQNQLRMSGKLGLATLTPVFPRPAGSRGGNLYIHALSRDALISRRPGLHRVDLQLTAMIDDAREKLGGAFVMPPTDVLMFGFSASADFATRFAVLHPDRVRALVAGGLGGLPILPVAKVDRQRLNFPLGIADLRTIVGKDFDERSFRRIPILLFQGALDENDSVPSRDSYTAAQQSFVFAAFGQMPASRVAKVRAVYADAGFDNVEYRLVPEAKHSMTPEMRSQTLEFLKRAMTQPSE